MTQGIYQASRCIADLAELARFAHELASRLRPGDVVALNGPLGAGKTTLVQQVGEALHLQERPVSPTFVLIHEYLSGDLPIVHADLYRLGEAQSETLADELIDVIESRQALMFVEWAQYGSFLAPYVSLTIDIAMNPQTEARVLTLSAARAEMLEGLNA